MTGAGTANARASSTPTRGTTTHAADKGGGASGPVHHATRDREPGKRLGRHRWVVERTLAWFARFRGSPSATSAGSTSCSASTASPPP